MSLRIRLSVIVSLLCLIGLALGTAFFVNSAKQRVANEVESSAALSYSLLNTLLSDPGARINVESKTELLLNLSQVDDARHLDIRLIGEADGTSDSLSSEPTSGAPAWFAAAVKPQPVEYLIPLTDGSQQFVQIRADPTDEIAEAWAESKNFMTVLALVLLLLNGILYIIIGQWFRPVRDILSGLDQVEHGNFGNLNTHASLPELRVISEKINRLGAVLKEARDENRKLARKSLLIQEEERKNLAQELHDDMGQSISAIKAIAFSISQRENDDKSTAGAEKIQDISSAMHQRVRGMMSKLRPTTLDELGLVPALQHMVDEWNDHHSDKFCSMKISDKAEASSPDFKINIYRIIQEALTNVARHSDASEVSVLLEVEDTVQLSIFDNGIGFNPDSVKAGLGLVGIRERAQALGGKCEIHTAKNNGVRINIRFEASPDALL